jgi:ankyrin repeat protein
MKTQKIMKTVLSICSLILVIFIISSGYSMAQEGSDLITAVAYQDLDKVKNLVETGVDINYQEESAGATALIMSAMYNFGDIARYLIEKGADISIKNKTGHTALMAAAGSSEEVFDLLVANGADMSVKLEVGTSAFMLSISGVMSDFVDLGNAKKLLDNGADVDESFTSGPAEGYTCLMMAARNQLPSFTYAISSRAHS